MTWLVEHLRPQAQQLSTSVSVFVSQPSSFAGDVQFVYPDAQVGAHVPALQARPPAWTWFDEQYLPHEPQFCVSFAVSVSQPSSAAGARGWLQLPHPVPHVELQRPPEQERDATWLVEHFRPQAPQLFASVETGVSQPSSAVGAAGCVQSS